MKLPLAMLLALAGAANAEDMAGRYVLQGVMETASQLALKPDGTFEYLLIYGAADYQARGTWRLDKDAVVLTTAGPEKPGFRPTGGEAAGHPGVLVWVRGPGGRPVPHIRVTLESAAGKTEKRTGSEGAAEFPGGASPKSVSFEVPVYGVRAGPFPLDPNQDDFRFEIDGEAITRVPFRDERLRIDGQALELRFWNAERAMMYRKR